MSMTRESAAPAFQHQPMAMPPGTSASHQTTGVARAVAFARGVTGQAFGLAVIVFALQAVMPQGSKPSDLIGSFHGSTRTAELDAERLAQAASTEAIANAQAKAAAQWAMEQEAARHQQQAILESLRAKQEAANLADYACMSGPVATAFFGRDAAGYAQTVQAACTEAQRLRREIVQEQAEAARIGSAIMQRPAPMPPAVVPAPVR